MSLLRSPRLLGATALLVVLAACDTMVSPTFGTACQQGTLAPGDTVLGRFTETSCQMEFDFWSYEHAPFEVYDVHLQQGHAYMIRLDSLPDTTYSSFDAELTLFTSNSDAQPIPLAVSDDDAGFHNSVLWFVAPVTGTFALRVSSYWYGGLGNFRLIMHECPVLGALDTAGVYNFTLGASPCQVPRAGGNGADTSAYNFVSVLAAPGEGISSTVTTSAFPAISEMFGPGFDVFTSLYSDSRSDIAKGTGVANSFTMGEVGGRVTIAVGATTVDSTAGAFTLTLARTPAAAPPALGSTWDLNAVAGMARKAPPASKH